jgi:hypothetical protein
MVVSWYVCVNVWSCMLTKSECTTHGGFLVCVCVIMCGAACKRHWSVQHMVGSWYVCVC